MTYLIDTDCAIDLLFDRAPTVSLRPILSQDGLAISEVTFGEVYDGVIHGRDAIAAEIAFSEFLTAIDVLPLTRDIWKQFAHIRGALRRRGQLISDFDIVIGATALEFDLTLVTYNVRHFERIPGLRIYEP